MLVKKLIIILLLLNTGLISLSAQKHYALTRISVNSPVSNEFAPVLFNNNIVFVSDRKNDWLKTTTDLQGNSLSDLYTAKQTRSGRFGNVQPFSSSINSRFYEGPASFSKDGKIMYFTRSIDISGKYNRLVGDSTYGIFTAELVNDEWVNVSPLPFNSDEYNVGFPCVTDDGKKLFFSSQAPGGFGGFDIYMCEWNYGAWGEPVNLGDEINTPENDIFPFFHPSGRLYFSSRGHNGKGGIDIFYSELIDEKWQRPVNLPDPFNSRDDDFGLIINTTLDTAFICSKRSGTMDIYMVHSTLPVFTLCNYQQENDYCFVFYDEGVIDLDTTSFKYEWDLGDGTKIKASEAEHCYKKPGNYIILLNVIDTITGEVSYNEATYEFKVEKIPQPYIIGADTARVNQEVIFNGYETYLPGTKIDKYYWDFGDGTRLINPEVRHTYSRPGNYEIQLGVTSVVNDEKVTAEKFCIKRKIVILK